ncbi:MAG: hypothetical protein ACPGGK_17905 [Pikeienuella sp.]
MAGPDPIDPGQTAAEQMPVASAARGLRGSLLLVAMFSALVNILMLTGPMFMMQLYDRVLSSGSVATLQGLFLIVVLLYGFMAVYDFLRTRLLSRAGYRLDQDLGEICLSRWVRSGVDQSKTLARPV